LGEREFFLAKARESDARALAARTDEERTTWRDIAEEYRRLAAETPVKKR
jgi:hypothetical protein